MHAPLWRAGTVLTAPKTLSRSLAIPSTTLAIFRATAMTPDQPVNAGDQPAKRADLRDAAEQLRRLRHLDPDAQAAIADLLEELSGVVETQPPPSAQAAHLANTAAALVQTLQHSQPGPLA